MYSPQWINNLEVAWSNKLVAKFLRRLGSFARVVFVDRRGMGLSDRLSATDVPPLETLVEDLRVVIDAAELNRPVLFGGSDAGCICALFGATHPDRASALIVYGPEARGTASHDYAWAWTTDRWDEYLADLGRGWGSDEYAAKILEWIMPSARGDPEQRRWWRTMQRLRGGSRARARFRNRALYGHRRRDRESYGHWRSRLEGARRTTSCRRPCHARALSGIEQDVAGDGFFATFDGRARGVKCAQAIVDAVRSLDIEVRAGVHTGEVGTAGTKASGIAVHATARLVALAGSSEILVSQTIKDLVAGSGLGFHDRGTRELKGIDGSWHLYAVASPSRSERESF